MFVNYAILDGLLSATKEEKLIVAHSTMPLQKFYKERIMIGVLIFGV